MGGVTDAPTVISQFKKILSGNRHAKWQPFLFGAITRFTPAILLLFAGLLFWHRITQDHISCITPPDEDVRISAVNQYCFITGTYTVTSYSEKYKNTRRTLPYPGVGPVLGNDTQLKYHLYFQWVPFVLLIQAIFLAFPDIMWRSLRQDKLSRYCEQIDPRVDNGENSENKGASMEGIGISAERFRKNLNHQSGFCYSFIFCEFMNVAALALAFILGDKLLAGEFWNLGHDWLDFVEKNNDTNVAPKPDVTSNPLDKVFPKMSKCEFKKYGPGGGLVPHDILCVMTLNVFHDKIFLFLWFWLVLLIGVQCVYLLLQAAVLVFRDLQLRLVLRRVEVAFLHSENRIKMGDSEIREPEFHTSSKDYLCSLAFGDWFLLYAIAECTDTEKFTDFFQCLVKNYTNGLTKAERYIEEPREKELYPDLSDMSGNDYEMTVLIKDKDPSSQHPKVNSDTFRKRTIQRGVCCQCQNHQQHLNYTHSLTSPDGTLQNDGDDFGNPSYSSPHKREDEHKTGDELD